MKKSVKIQNVYALTPMQEGMLFNYLYHKESKAYFQQLCFSIEANLDIEILEKSYNQVIERYDVFRTIFVYDKVEEPKQVVLAERIARLYYEDISHMTVEDSKYFIEQYKDKDRDKGFDLTKDILMRLSIIKVGPNNYQMIWSHHHIIMDGWCLGLVVKDFISIYRSIKYGEGLRLEKVYRYADYLNWLVKQDKSKASHYWKHYLEDYDNELFLLQTKKTKTDDYDKRELHLAMDKALTSQMVDLCKKNNVTLNNAFQAIWAVLLQKYNNVDDVVFGTVVSGRNAPIDGIDKMVGVLINTIPIRVHSHGHLSFKNLIKQVRDDFNQSLKFDYLSLAQIQKLCHVKQNLIHHLFIFENYPARDIMNKGDSYAIKDAQSFEQTNYDFSIIVIPSDEIQIKLIYNACVYEDKAVVAIKNHLLKIITCICMNTDILLKDINMLTADEYDQLVYKFNQNKMGYPIHATIHELFDQQVEKTPEDIAVVYNEDTISYQALNEKANSVARGLKNLGVKRNTVVALITERSIEMIIGILSILKAGGAYLPIDPKYPAERCNYMLDDSKASLLITNTDIQDLSFKGTIVDLKDSTIYGHDQFSLLNSNSANDLAYIIYTSGSTGQPKGVMIEHRSVINLSYNLYKKVYQSYTSKLNVSLLSPYVFDASIQQIFTSLLFGHTLVIIPEEVRLDGRKLVDYYIKHGVDISDGTPAHLSIIQDMLIDKDIQLSTKQFLIGGEELSIDLVRKMFHTYQNKSLKITNVYGPTECCDISTMFDMDNKKVNQLIKIPIGRNLENTQIYILDKQLKPMPFNTPGEIVISGDGLSRGYLNHQELTDEKFIDNPFITGAKMYRTGDLGKRLMNGEIEYLGRMDQQVKIRGFRVELGEIKKQILSCDGIKETAVICGNNQQGSKYIAAFVISNSRLKADDLRNYLSKRLPHYMIPTHILEIKKIPVTHNGKLNKNKLLKMIKTEPVHYTAPRNPMEKELLTIWEQVLDITQIGIDDDFFELGGDSIKAIKILSKANQIKLLISVKDILEYRTVARIMDNYYTTNGIDIDRESTPCVQPDDLEKERIYNKRFKVTMQYPSYYGCMVGVVLEKLKYEKNIELERSFLPVGGGKFYITYGHVNDEGLKKKLVYRELPTEMNPAAIHMYDKLGVKEKVISFKDLKTGLAYCEEHLRKNEIVMVSGTTYYLNYSPDYCIGEEEWKRRLDIRPENIIAVSNKSSGRAHTFLLIDIIKDGYVVYDATYNYFGFIPKEDFNQSFAGLKGMRFLDGMFAQTTNMPYVITELDFSKLKALDNKQVAIEILKNNIDINLSNRQVDFKANGYDFTFYIGVQAYKEIASMLTKYGDEKQHWDELKKLIQSSFDSWKYKFMFFQEFLEDSSKYIELPKNCLDVCNSFIKDCTMISTQAKGKNTNSHDFITTISSRLLNIYDQHVSFLNQLKGLLP